MCGLVGFSGSFNEEALRYGLTAITHRGPDDSGLFYDKHNQIGLAHSRLSILELSSFGHQPMVSDEGVVLVFNGEIYNYKKIRSILEDKGYKFNGCSDTEVLLKLYLDRRYEMLDLLNGMFAFALWDGRDGSLFIARDALGVKPLYFSQQPNGIAFGSEIKALNCLLSEKSDIDLLAIHQYLGYLWCPGERTPFDSVRKVQPGAALIISKGQIKKHWNWYQLPLFYPSINKTKSGDWIKSTALCLKESVHRQLVSDVPVGAFLSGGLDSSAVVAFAREKMPEIKCFTIEMDGGQDRGGVDDLPFAKRVAKHLDVSLEIVRIDSRRMADDVENMIQQLEEPLADPAPLNVFYISQLAREHGIKVLLSGVGGDDLFTGYRRHYALTLERWWSWLPVIVRSGLENVAMRLDQRHPFGRRLAKLFNGAALNGDERIANYFLWGRRESLLDLYLPAARKKIQDSNLLQPMLDFLATTPDALSDLDRMMLLDQRFFLADHNLLYSDKMSMAAGVEVRVPFLDVDVVKFSSTIPNNLKQRSRAGKWVLKKAMEPYLPYDVINRPKTGFGAPLRRWMRHELRELLGDYLSSDSLAKRGIFDAYAVQKLIADNDSGRVDASYTLFSILCIEIWLRKYIDNY